MYVCICNAIRECELRKLARTHRGDAHTLYSSLGRPPQCGQCVEEAEDIIEDERVACGQAAHALSAPVAVPALENGYQPIAS